MVMQQKLSASIWYVKQLSSYEYCKFDIISSPLGQLSELTIIQGVMVSPFSSTLNC